MKGFVGWVTISRTSEIITPNSVVRAAGNVSSKILFCFLLISIRGTHFFFFLFSTF